MDFFASDLNESIERELSRTVCDRLLGWSVISLWAVAILLVFSLFADYSPVVDKLLIWISPLLIIRSIGSVLLYKQFRAAVNVPSLTTMTRMSMLFSVSDGILVLTSVILLFSAGSSVELVLAFGVTGFLALTAYVYMYTQLATLLSIGIVLVPIIALYIKLPLDLPLGLIVACVGILAATLVGCNRFKSLYVNHLTDKLSYQHEIQQVAESNFIFNEHWQKMHVAAIDWDRDCVIRSWNPAAERLFGITSEQAKGHSLELLFDRETAADIRSQWLHAKTDTFEPPVLRSHGPLTNKPLTCWYDTPLFHDDELIGTASFIIDIYEQPLNTHQQLSKPLPGVFGFGKKSHFPESKSNSVATGQ